LVGIILLILKSGYYIFPARNINKPESDHVQNLTL